MEGSEQTLKCELLLIAAGFRPLGLYSPPPLAWAHPVPACRLRQGDTRPAYPGVFTAGDMHWGQSLVVWAIQEGRAAAGRWTNS
ncbi:MAG: hypothetical protein ACLSAF_17110 [Intestinimonas sp.]